MNQFEIKISNIVDYFEVPLIPRVRRQEKPTEAATAAASGFSLATSATEEEEKSDLATV